MIEERRKGGREEGKERREIGGGNGWMDRGPKHFLHGYACACHNACLSHIHHHTHHHQTDEKEKLLKDGTALSEKVAKAEAAVKEQEAKVKTLE